MTNKEQVAGKWDQFVGEMKQQYGKLTDQTFEYGLKGEWDKVKGSFKEAYGDAKEQAEFDAKVDAYNQGLKDGSCGTKEGCGCSGKDAA